MLPLVVVVNLVCPYLSLPLFDCNYILLLNADNPHEGYIAGKVEKVLLRAQGRYGPLGKVLLGPQQFIGRHFPYSEPTLMAIYMKQPKHPATSLMFLGSWRLSVEGKGCLFSKSVI